MIMCVFCSVRIFQKCGMRDRDLESAEARSRADRAKNPAPAKSRKAKNAGLWQKDAGLRESKFFCFKSIHEFDLMCIA